MADLQKRFFPTYVGIGLCLTCQHNNNNMLEYYVSWQNTSMYVYIISLLFHYYYRADSTAGMLW